MDEVTLLGSYPWAFRVHGVGSSLRELSGAVFFQGLGDPEVPFSGFLYSELWVEFA